MNSMALGLIRRKPTSTGMLGCSGSGGGDRGVKGDSKLLVVDPDREGNRGSDEGWRQCAAGPDEDRVQAPRAEGTDRERWKGSRRLCNRED